MKSFLEKIKNMYNTFAFFIFSNTISCVKSKNINLQNEKYIVIGDTGQYYIHIYDNHKFIHININNKKTKLESLNLLNLEENDILSQYNNDYFNILICKNDKI